MAKSARASTKKANKTALRAKTFRPVEDARNERLHQKLVDLVASKKDVIMAVDDQRRLKTALYYLSLQLTSSITETNTRTEEAADEPTEGLSVIVLQQRLCLLGACSHGC